MTDTHTAGYRQEETRRSRPSSESTSTSTVQSRPRTASCSSPPLRRRRRLRQRPTPSPLSLAGDSQADTLTDESGESDQESFQSSSLSPMSSMSPSTPTTAPGKSNQASPLLRRRSSMLPCQKFSYHEAPKSPGIVRSSNVSPFTMSPRNISPSSRRETRSPSPRHSPAASSPRGPGPGRTTPRSPRSPSPHPLRSARISQSAVERMDNMALLASRRNKYRQTARVERRTSNFLELPGRLVGSTPSLCLAVSLVIFSNLSNFSRGSLTIIIMLLILLF